MSGWGGRLVWALVVLSWASSAFAQAVYGSLSGTVTDDSGGVLPGVTITVTSIERKTADLVLSNDSGFFVKDRLLPGLYEVKAELTGFKVAVVPTVTVGVDSQTPVNFQLEVGTISEAVTVTGGAPLLRTDRADVASTFEAKQLTELPVLDRNFTKFLLLTPGTQNFTWQQNAAENPQGSTQIQVNGQHFSGTGYQLDGTENRDPILGIIVINPSLESVAEAKVTSQNYDAEFGQAVAGVVSVRTKSGSNQFSGSAFEFHRNESWQARDPFTQFEPDPVTGRFVPETTHNQFGGSFGGPIMPNRWFFFGDYEGTRDTLGGSQLLSVPTEAARRGDLSAYGVDIFDPRSAAAPDQRARFAGNIIPAERLSPQAQALLNLIPPPNTAGVDNGTRDNFVASGSQTFTENSINARIDGRLNDKLNTFGRYSTGDFFTDGPTALGQGGGAPLGGNLGGVSDVRNHSVAYGLDYTFSPSLLADFRFGFFRYDVNVLPFDFGTTPARDAGIPGLNLDETFTSSLPAFFLRANQPDMNWGSGLGVNGCNCPLDQDEKQWQIVGNVTKLVGNHTVKVGIDVRRAYNLRVPSDSHRSGELTFQGQRTSGGSTRGGGLGLATFLLGDVTSFRRYFSERTDARERQWRHFYYAQDTWRVNPKLTLNYGLRLDIINPQTMNEAGNGGYLDFETGEIVVAGIEGVDLAGDVENSLNWAPRVGATYQLNERTVIRAGYGRSYDIGVFGSLFGHSVTQNLPVLAVQSLSAPSDFDQVFTLSQGPPAPTFPDASGGRFPLPDGVQSFVLPQKQRLPAVDAFNVTVQRQLTDTMSLEVGYVGNRGRRVFADGPDMDPNQPTLDGFGTVPRDLRRPFFAGLRTPVENLGGAFGWTQNFRYYCNCAENWYDSLQTRFSKRFSEGYLANVNYTWQRAKQETGDYFFWDRDLNHGPPDWDRAHTLVVSGVAEVPIGRNRRYLSDIAPIADILVGGWQVNMNYTWTTGRPFNVGYRDSEQDRDTGPDRPDLIGDPEGPKTRDEWFNATPIGSAGSAFGRPAAGTFGSLTRNALRGPHFWQADASVFKDVRLPNDHVLEIRFEAVNVFNHTNLGLPDATVGVPGNENSNAGRISSTSGPQRFVQFGLRYSF